jgi:uncharacterized protein
MTDILALASANLLTPMILCFALGLFAALARSNCRSPRRWRRGCRSICCSPSASRAGCGRGSRAGRGFSRRWWCRGGAVFLLPFAAFALLKVMTRLSDRRGGGGGALRVDQHRHLRDRLIGRCLAGMAAEGYMVAVAAAMEAPGDHLGAVAATRSGGRAEKMDADLWREILLNGSIVLLVGSFLIGWSPAQPGMARIEASSWRPFQGVLCLFLLDMGLVAGRGMRNSRGVLDGGGAGLRGGDAGRGGGFGLAAGMLLGLSTGGVALLMTLLAPRPATSRCRRRCGWPAGREPVVYLTLSLGVTFPFNLVIGIPAWVAVATAVGG